jgi:hypothetical protein
MGRPKSKNPKMIAHLRWTKEKMEAVKKLGNGSAQVGFDILLDTLIEESEIKVKLRLESK